MYTIPLTESLFPAVLQGEIPRVSIGEALRQAAQDAADVIALKEATLTGEIGRAWTYHELYQDSLRLAYALLQRHRSGDRIAIWAHNIPEWVLLEYAAALAGLTLVTVNPSFRARELKYVLEKSRASALYVVQVFRGNPIAAIAAEVCRDLPAITCVIDLQDPQALFKGSEIASELPLVRADDAAQIQYTSGTTGFPKGAVLSHSGLHGNGKLVFERARMTRGDVWLNFMPMFHTGGCALGTLGSLSARATMILAALFDPAAMNSIIEQERVTGLLAVPTMLVGLIDANAVAPRDLSSVRTILSGGSMVAPELVRQAQATFGGASFQIIYGQTETSPVLTAVWSDATMDMICGTVGQPLPHIELSIRDPQTNQPVPLAQTGEVCARGPMNMLRYEDDPEGTAETVDAERWLHTGDLGSMDQHGNVAITGRIKEMIIRGGENLFPAEIENAMLEHPAVAEIAVVGLPDDKYGEIVACFVRLRPEHSRPSAADLTRFCRERLSAQKTPAVWVALTEWPLTASGKIRKFMLRDQYRAGEYRGNYII